jgi:hypothetical protein
MTDVMGQVCGVGGPNIFAGFQPREARVSFVSRDVQASCLILNPRPKCIVPQSFTTFLALDVPLYGFAHKRIRRSSLCFRKAQQTVLDIGW